jgi:hypothetical protein
MYRFPVWRQATKTKKYLEPFFAAKSRCFWHLNHSLRDVSLSRIASFFAVVAVHWAPG